MFLKAVIRLYRNDKGTGAEMRPVIASGIVTRTRRSATGQFFSLSLVTVPEVFANVNSFQFPSVSKVANEKTLRASYPGRSGGGAGKKKRACNYVSGIRISASKKSMQNADLRR